MNVTARHQYVSTAVFILINLLFCIDFVVREASSFLVPLSLVPREARVRRCQRPSSNSHASGSSVDRCCCKR